MSVCGGIYYYTIKLSVCSLNFINNHALVVGLKNLYLNIFFGTGSFDEFNKCVIVFVTVNFRFAKPEKIYYQGLALAALGRIDEAESKFRMLLEYGQEHRGDQVVMDYFAVSLPDLAIWDEDLTLRNVAHCDLMMRLGSDGLSRIGK